MAILERGSVSCCHILRKLRMICALSSLCKPRRSTTIPAITFCQTGFQLAGRPSIGAWVAYGLGSDNRDLPSYVVMASRGTGRAAGQPLYERLWGSGFLPSKHQGVKLRSGKEPVLYLDNPAGCTTQLRREMLDGIKQLNEARHEVVGDPEILTRIAQYELSFRMQSSVPDLTDISDESEIL